MLVIVNNSAVEIGRTWNSRIHVFSINSQRLFTGKLCFEYFKKCPYLFPQWLYNSHSIIGHKGFLFSTLYSNISYFLVSVLSDNSQFYLTGLRRHVLWFWFFSPLTMPGVECLFMCLWIIYCVFGDMSMQISCIKIFLLLSCISSFHISGISPLLHLQISSPNW